MREFVTGLDETDPTALAFGAGCLAVILGLRLISPRLPGVLIAVVGATALVAALGLSDELPIVGSVPSGLPQVGWPDVALSDATVLLPAAIGIAFVAFADTSVLSRSYAARLHQPVDQNRELAALGAANLAAGVFQGFPVSSSGSRTAVVEDMGARSQFAGLAGALTLGAAAARRHRPGPRHAAERPGRRGHRRRARPVRRARRPPLVRVAADRVRALPRRVRRRRRARRAVGCRDRDRAEPAQLHPSLLVPARRRARPRREPQGLPRHRRYPDATLIPGLVLYRFDAPLFFANTDSFSDRVRALAEADGTRWVVIAAEPITDIDATAGETLAALHGELHAAGRTLAFAELKDPVRDLLRRYGIEAAIGPERFYPTVGVAVATYLAETGTAWTDWEDRSAD